MNFKSKIFITFLFLLTFILFFNVTNVFARTLDELSFPESLESICDTEEIYNGLISLPEFSDEYFYYYRRGYDVVFIRKSAFPDFKFYIEPTVSSSDPNRYCIIHSGIGNITATDSNDIVHYIWKDTYFKKSGVNSFSYTYDGGTNNIIGGYTNAVIYTDSTCSEVFFQVPVQGVVIPALETAEQIPQVIAKTLMILIPVGLVVLGIGLVVYLIKQMRFLAH